VTPYFCKNMGEAINLLCKHIKLFPIFYFSPASNTICTIKKTMPIIFSVSLTYYTIFATFYSFANKALPIWKAIPPKPPHKMFYLRGGIGSPQLISLFLNSPFFFIYQHKHDKHS
jgi:carbon starvation protein CstA